MTIEFSDQQKAECIALIKAHASYAGHEAIELVMMYGFPSSKGTAAYFTRRDLADLSDTQVYRTFVVYLDDSGKPESVGFFDSQRTIDGAVTLPPVASDD